MSTRESVLAAFSSKLIAASVASARVYRSRQDALASDELPAVVIEPLGESASETSLGMLDRTLTVRVSASNATEKAASAGSSVSHSYCMISSFYRSAAIAAAVIETPRRDESFQNGTGPKFPRPGAERPKSHRLHTEVCHATRNIARSWGRRLSMDSP